MEFLIWICIELQKIFFSLCTHACLMPIKTVLLETNPFYGEFRKCTDDFCMVAQIISPALPSNYHGRIKYTNAKEMKEYFIKTLML